VPQVQLPQTAAAVPLPLPLHAAKALLRQNPFALCRGDFLLAVNLVTQSAGVLQITAAIILCDKAFDTVEG
jgi:hypothetical protein